MITTKVFISYAKEDSKIAAKVIARLRDEECLNVVDWQNPAEKGKRVIPWIEQQIGAADKFVALLSPHYMNSDYCQSERDFAIRLEKGTEKKQFIHVAKIEDVSVPDAGLLGEFEYFDLTNNNFEKGVRDLIEALTGEQNGDGSSSWPKFQNRRQELNVLLHHLQNPGGDRFFVLRAAPKLGKTWLLNRLEQELKERDSDWDIRKIDLRIQNVDIRTRANALVGQYCDGVSANSEDQQDISKTIAVEISRAQKPNLWILDSAELLSESAAKDLRKMLSHASERLEEDGSDATRLAFVAASRTDFKAWSGIRHEQPAFHVLALTAFTHGIIRNALQEMAEIDSRHKLGQPWYIDMARSLLDATEGLPQLLMVYMERIRQEGYLLPPEDIRSQELFNEIAVPYIEKHLLSADSLFAFTTPSEQVEEKHTVLKDAFTKLSPYRRLSESHLARLQETDSGFASQLETARWSIRELWNALGQTFVIMPSRTLLHQMYPSIRKLLFRYAYRTREAQRNTHQNAYQEIGDWWRDFSGTDRAFYLVESLWHFSELQRLSGNPNGASEVLDWVDETFPDAIQRNHAPGGDVSSFIAARLDDDHELQTTLNSLNAKLYDQIVSKVETLGVA